MIPQYQYITHNPLHVPVFLTSFITGYRYIEVFLINVILALFSDDPNPITNPITQCEKISQSLF